MAAAGTRASSRLPPREATVAKVRSGLSLLPGVNRVCVAPLKRRSFFS
jgi:hypothetical protein